MSELLEKKLPIFSKSNKEKSLDKEDGQSCELQFRAITAEILQTCNIGKENTEFIFLY